jgi:ribosome-binding protein aMBF1 (putative translation factor)
MTEKYIQTSDKIADEFTEFMKLHRALNGLSQVMLAEKIGVSHSCVGQWERNESSPRYGKVKNLAETFNVSSIEIFTLISKRKNA